MLQSNFYEFSFSRLRTALLKVLVEHFHIFFFSVLSDLP
jgi:hypothetical protein